MEASGGGQSVPAAIPALVAFAVLATQGYLALGRNFANVVETPFFPYCLLGAFAIHMATRPGVRERLWTLALAAVSMAWFVGLSGKFRPSGAGVLACCAFLGLSSLTVLAVQVLRLRGDPQVEKLHTLFAGSVFGYSALLIGGVLSVTTALHPQTYDLYLYAADQGYGIPICAWTGQFLARQHWLFVTCAQVYESLPLAVSLLYAYQRSGAKPLGIRVLAAFLGGGVAVYALYNILPGAGPYYAFDKAFPDHLPQAVGLHVVKLLQEGPRNAIPSMHLGCALLIFWNCRQVGRWVYFGSALYLVITVLACLGLGEHYVVDLVAAVPYVLLLQAVCAPAELRSRPEWRQSRLAGAILTLAWIAAVRFGAPLFHWHAFAWTLSMVTLAVCGVARHRMLPAEAGVQKRAIQAI